MNNDLKPEIVEPKWLIYLTSITKTQKQDMGYTLTTEYREYIEVFLKELVENCKICEDTSDMQQSALILLEQLEQYSQKH